MLDGLKKIGCEVTACGSRVTCNPPVMDTDQDYLVFVKDKNMLKEVIKHLNGGGWEIDGGEHYQDTADNTFLSYRHADYNLIVTKNEDFARNHRLATMVCKSLNLLKKQDRILVFRAMIYNESPPDDSGPF